MPSIDTLVSDIQKLFTDGHSPDEDLLNAYAEACKVSAKSALNRDRSSEDFRLRLSAVGKPHRKLWYESRPDTPQEILHHNVFVKFAYGNILEDFLLWLCKEAGHEVSHEQETLSIGGIKGHCDAVIDGYVVDVKSASNFGFEKFKDGSIREGDSFNYIPQLAAYSQALGGLPGAFLAINKVTGGLALCQFTAEELARIPIEEFIEKQKEVVSQETPPDRCYSDKPDGKSGNRSLKTECHYCLYKHYCWSDANDGQGLRTFLYSNGPKYYTNVAKEPRVKEII